VRDPSARRYLIAGAVAGGNVHASAQRHGEMGKVPAYADALGMSFGRSAVAPGVVVAEFDEVMHVVADRLHALPAAIGAAEPRPGEIGKFFSIAVTARSASSGKAATSHCGASGAISSGRPLSAMMKSLRISRSPGGAINRV
jgi:hypothetical protein